MNIQMKHFASAALVFFAALTAHSADAVKVACVGDSITYGTGLADRASQSYPAQLQKMLDARFPGKYEVRNFGNPGRGIYLDSMRGAEERGFRHMPEHKAALAWKPDIVVCNLGINDNGEYIKEYAGGRKRGQFRDDYIALLRDYKEAVPGPGPRIAIWTKLAPLAEGQRFWRSPEPFLMQDDLEAVAFATGADRIDMQEPLRENLDKILAADKIHPDAEGARIIAETVFRTVTSPHEVRECRRYAAYASRDWETWLCAGQSNMQKGWGEFSATPEEKARFKSEMERLAKVRVSFWDFATGEWKRLTPGNAAAKCAFGVSFAIRRAEKTGREIKMVYVAAGGAPTESFLSEQVMCAVDSGGRPVYPHLAAIATNRRRLDRNADFPCAWVAREYPRRRGNKEEAFWWPVSALYDGGLKKFAETQMPVDGILWYQGESNATRCVPPEAPLDGAYMEETLLAVMEQFRRLWGGAKVVVVGLPAMDRPWAPYRAAQKKVAGETGAIFVDTFAAGLGDPRDVHPRNKIPFAELALKAIEDAGGVR